jgi:hypothetical protein
MYFKNNSSKKNLTSGQVWSSILNVAQFLKCSFNPTFAPKKNGILKIITDRVGAWKSWLMHLWFGDQGSNLDVG